MATAWDVASVGWSMMVLGWLVSPIITFPLPKIISYLGFEFHTSEKLRELEFHIIPELQKTLSVVDQERMLERGKKVKCDVASLDKIAAILRHAREDAEDIFDDEQEVKLYCSRFWHRLYRVVATCIARCESSCVWIASIIRSGSARSFQRAPMNSLRMSEDVLSVIDSALSTCIAGFNRSCMWVPRTVLTGSARLLQWAWKIFLPRQKDVLPVTITTIAPSDQTVLVTTNDAAPDELIMDTAAPSDSELSSTYNSKGKVSGEPVTALPDSFKGDVSDEPVTALPDSVKGEVLDKPLTALSDSFKGEVSDELVTALPDSFKGEVSDEPVTALSDSFKGEVSDEPVTALPDYSKGEVLDKPVTALPNSFKGEVSDEPVTALSDSFKDEVSDEQVTGLPDSFKCEVPDEPVTAVSDSSCWCSSFDFFNSCFWSTCTGIVDAFEVACTYRNWSYDMVNIRNNQENATTLDYVLTAISRWKLKKRIEKLGNTVNEVKKSQLLGVASNNTPDDITNKNRSRIRTASKRKVFGREGLRGDIMAWLRETPERDAASSSASTSYLVIGIYGVAGSGKTTFAGYIQDYIKVECKEEELFDTIMCIHVSEIFNLDDIFHEMLKDITKDRHSNISDHEDLEGKLKESLRDKRFFLILDDLWVQNKNDPQLVKLKSALAVGKKGSKILVTARTKYAVGAMCVEEPIKMPDLDEEEYFSMFMHYALDGTPIVDEEFKSIGREIVKNLHRSPIAAATVAGRLGAYPDIRFWKNAAKIDMLTDTMDALWWSYQQLNPDIRQCFEFCSIFPRRFYLRKDQLVRLWIAQGFVKTSSATEEMEDVAEGYVQELVSCSFLQPEVTNWSDDDCFRIHDLLHDL